MLNATETFPGPSEPANSLYRTGEALPQVPLSRAVTGNAKVAEGKVVAEGVADVEATEASGDIQGHGPPRTLHLGQADVARNPGDMGIQGNNKLVLPNLRPHAAIHAVVRPRHPAQIKVHSLACASIGRRRHQEAHTDASLQFPARIKLLETRCEERR